MNIFFNERRFWRNVLERLIDIALFLSERNLAFRGSEEVLGSPHNGNFLGIFELLARRDPILKELQDRIKNKNTKDHYLSPTIQNELIELLATEVEKENLQQLKLAKYFSIILDCTPDMSHHEQMSVILRYVLCNGEAAVVNPQLTEKNACIFYRWGPLDPNYVIFEKSLDYLQIYFSLVQMP